MFTHNMVESRQSTISMSCIDSSALESLVNFAYTGRVSISTTNVQNLMLGASFLQLSKVRDACAEFLQVNNCYFIANYWCDFFFCRSLVILTEKIEVVNLFKINKVWSENNVHLLFLVIMEKLTLFSDHTLCIYLYLGQQSYEIFPCCKTMHNM